jgi:hypothetical protein
VRAGTANAAAAGTNPPKATKTAHAAKARLPALLAPRNPVVTAWLPRSSREPRDSRRSDRNAGFRASTATWRRITRGCMASSYGNGTGLSPRPSPPGPGVGPRRSTPLMDGVAAVRPAPTDPRARLRSGVGAFLSPARSLGVPRREPDRSPRAPRESRNKLRGNLFGHESAVPSTGSPRRHHFG